MAKLPKDPEKCEYLAVVSEWSSTTRQGGVVGNAYPLVNLSLTEVVTEPREEFPNPGAVFLLNRSQFKTWDFIILRPRRNDQYKDDSDRACYFIPTRSPELVISEGQLEKVAIILNHPTFEPESAVRYLLNPTQNVTPYFFIQKNDKYYGPLSCLQRQHAAAEEDIQRIDWRAVREDGIIYEFTLGDLSKQGLQMFEYRHPDGYLNRVISSPITIAFGDIARVTSGKPLDTLTDIGIIDWYLTRCQGVEVPAGYVSTLRNAFKRSHDDPLIIHTRLRKVERYLAEHGAFADYREKIIRHFLESEAGAQRIQEVIEQTVARKAVEIQGEVDRREKELAAKRNEYDHKAKEMEKEFEAKAAEKQAELAGIQEKIDNERKKLQSDVDDLTRARRETVVDIEKLHGQIREHIPLIAALFDSRPPAGLVPTATAVIEARPAAPAAKFEFPPVAPSKPLTSIAEESILVAQLHAALARAGLHYSKEFISNIYTCLKAEALNLIIGPPGYGKSMLITALAAALGHESAFLRIAVRRSWAEDRFLLGAYDNFHGRYDPGHTGLVERMLQAESDWKMGRRGIYLVLLDEFNLAAPEYYFSQLLQTLPTDEIRKIRELRLYERGTSPGDGFPNRVTLGPNLRFWGTINYDETTERLSPRVLDRTGMIFLSELDVPSTTTEDDLRAPAVSASEVFDKFLKTENDCPDEHWDLVNEVIDLLRRPDAASGPRIELSPRVHGGIRRYLANSVGVLSARTAVDFVIQQRILPVVRGRGEDFLVRVRQLAQLLAKQNLTRSAKHVEEAIRRSEQHFGELDFLSY